MDNKYIACHFKHKTVRKKILNYILTSKVVETVNNVLYDQNYNLALMGIWWVYNDCNTESLTAEKNNVYYPIIRFLFCSGTNDGSKFWHEMIICFQTSWKFIILCFCIIILYNYFVFRYFVELSYLLQLFSSMKTYIKDEKEYERHRNGNA